MEPYTALSQTASSPIPIAHSWYEGLGHEGIVAACNQLAAAWSSGDLSALASAFASDCDHITLTRVRQLRRGREALIASWAETFGRRTPEFSVRMTVHVQNVRELDEDFGLVDGMLEYSAGLGAGGVWRGRSSQPFTAVVARRESAWIIKALRVGAATPASKVMTFTEDSH